MGPRSTSKALDINKQLRLLLLRAHALERWMPKFPVLRPCAVLDLGDQQRLGEDRPLALQRHRRVRRRDRVEQFAQIHGLLVAPPCATPADIDEIVSPPSSQQQPTDRARHCSRLIADDHEGVAPRAFDLQPFGPTSRPIWRVPPLGDDAFEPEPDTPPPDPIPPWVDPCLAMLVDRPPAGPSWLY